MEHLSDDRAKLAKQILAEIDKWINGEIDTTRNDG